MYTLLALALPAALALGFRSLFTWRLLALAGAGLPLILIGSWRGWPLASLAMIYDAADRKSVV